MIEHLILLDLLTFVFFVYPYYHVVEIDNLICYQICTTYTLIYRHQVVSQISTPYTVKLSLLNVSSCIQSSWNI
jgi:hypothetical protein